MDKLDLMKPSMQFSQAYLAMNREKIDHDIRLQGILSLTEGELEAEITRWQHREENGDDWTSGIPTSHFWLIRSDRDVIGTCSLRHRLDEQLLAIGHVDYGIRPTERGKGYGTRQLALLLAKAGEMGMTRVIVALSADNIASRRVIEKNGGQLYSQLPHPRSGVPGLQYLFELQEPSGS